MALSQESRSIIELPTPIERADRLPAGRVPLLAFVADRQTKTDVEESLAPLALADSPVMRGGIVKAIQFLASERSPETLIVDISGVEMPAARIQARRGLRAGRHSHRHRRPQRHRAVSRPDACRRSRLHRQAGRA